MGKGSILANFLKMPEKGKRKSRLFLAQCEDEGTSWQEKKQHSGMRRLVTHTESIVRKDRKMNSRSAWSFCLQHTSLAHRMVWPTFWVYFPSSLIKSLWKQPQRPRSVFLVTPNPLRYIHHIKLMNMNTF